MDSSLSGKFEVADNVSERKPYAAISSACQTLVDTLIRSGIEPSCFRWLFPLSDVTDLFSDSFDAYDVTLLRRIIPNIDKTDPNVEAFETTRSTLHVEVKQQLENVFGRFLKFLIHLASPVVLMVDDLEWVDGRE